VKNCAFGRQSLEVVWIAQRDSFDGMR